MAQEIWIPAYSGSRIDVSAGQKIFLPNAQTIRRSSSPQWSRLTVTNRCARKWGDIVYSNLYRPLPRVVRDDAGRHNLLFPNCRRETYDFFYRNGEGYSNCYDNINGRMEQRRSIIRPLNLFMNTKVEADGRLTICPPVSEAGNCIVLETLVSLHIGVATCSISEEALQRRELQARSRSGER